MPLSPFQIVADISDTETQDREEGGGEGGGGEGKIQIGILRIYIGKRVVRARD